MIFLYTFALCMLGAAKILIDRRVASLEKRYLRTVDAADQLLRGPAPRTGNGNRLDAAQAAKHQVALGLLVQKQDYLEAKYENAQKSAKKFADFVARVKSWKGKKLPYTMGVLDVSVLLALVDYLGAGEYVNFRNLSTWVSTVLGQ
jgi:hypothetical protein